MLAAALLIPSEELLCAGTGLSPPVLLEPGQGYSHPKDAGDGHDLPWSKLQLGAQLSLCDG